jgi:hypothetical protein
MRGKVRGNCPPRESLLTDLAPMPKGTTFTPQQEAEQWQQVLKKENYYRQKMYNTPWGRTLKEEENATVTLENTGLYDIYAKNPVGSKSKGTTRRHKSNQPGETGKLEGPTHLYDIGRTADNEFCSRCTKDIFRCPHKPETQKAPKDVTSRTILSSQECGWRDPLDNLKTSHGRTALVKETFYRQQGVNL